MIRSHVNSSFLLCLCALQHEHLSPLFFKGWAPPDAAASLSSLNPPTAAVILLSIYSFPQSCTTPTKCLFTSYMNPWCRRYLETQPNLFSGLRILSFSDFRNTHVADTRQTWPTLVLSSYKFSYCYVKCFFLNLRISLRLLGYAWKFSLKCFLKLLPPAPFQVFTTHHQLFCS